MYRVGIITASDKGAAGERIDTSSEVIRKIVTDHGYNVCYYEMLPDDQDSLERAMKKVSDENIVDLLLTTGGTGLSPRDVTPEATIAIAERMVPGIAEAMRANSMNITKRAMLSRGVVAIRNKTLIINLPGSPKAVAENLEYVIDDVKHGLEALLGMVYDCANDRK